MEGTSSLILHLILLCAFFCLACGQRTLDIEAPAIRAPGYKLHRGVGYYKIHSELKTWHEARQICAQEGGHLAIINSEEESKVLQSIFAPVHRKLIGECKNYAFIGFHDLYNEGQYLTVFDKPLISTGFTRWYRRPEPNNLFASATNPGEDCGSMNINGGLNDSRCHLKCIFICEQELWPDSSADLTAPSKPNEYFDSGKSLEISPEISLE